MKVFFEFEQTENEIANKMLELINRSNKYKLMWALRHLESEINEEGGQLIITSARGRSGIQMNGFTEELKDQIKAVIDQFQFDSL